MQHKESTDKKGKQRKRTQAEKNTNRGSATSKENNYSVTYDLFKNL